MAENNIHPKFYSADFIEKRPKWLDTIVEEKLLDSLHNDDKINLISANWNRIVISYMLLQMTARYYNTDLYFHRDLTESEIDKVPTLELGDPTFAAFADEEKEVLKTMKAELVPQSYELVSNFGELAYLWKGELFSTEDPTLINSEEVLNIQSKLFKETIAGRSKMHNPWSLLQLVQEVRKVSLKCKRLPFWDKTPDALKTTLRIYLNHKAQ